MKNATVRRGTVLWRCLVWLVPVACLIALGVLAYVAAEAVTLPASSGWRTFWFRVVLLYASWEVLILAAGVAATIFAMRGADMAALLVLAAVSAAALSLVGPLDWSHLSSEWVFSLVLGGPVIVAAGLAVAGVLVLRGRPIAVRVAVIALLAVPTARLTLSLVTYLVRTHVGH